MSTEEQRAIWRERARRWRAEHPGYYNEYKRQRYAAGLVKPEDPAKARTRARVRRAADPERIRKQERERKRRGRAVDPERYREANRRWVSAHPDQARQARLEGVRRYNQRVRDAVFDHYGRACACCGATDRLTIDHINGNGREHRQALFGKQLAGPTMYAWLIKQGFPEGFQTLCRRCNRSKGTGEHCRLDHAKAA